MTDPYLILFNAFLCDVCKILNSLFTSLNVMQNYVIKEHYGHQNYFSRVIVISKIRHQTCQISDFHTECYMGGGGGQIYRHNFRIPHHREGLTCIN